MLLAQGAQSDCRCASHLVFHHDDLYLLRDGAASAKLSGMEVDDDPLLQDRSWGKWDGLIACDDRGCGGSNRVGGSCENAGRVVGAPLPGRLNGDLRRSAIASGSVERKNDSSNLAPLENLDRRQTLRSGAGRVKLVDSCGGHLINNQSFAGFKNSVNIKFFTFLLFTVLLGFSPVLLRTVNKTNKRKIVKRTKIISVQFEFEFVNNPVDNEEIIGTTRVVYAVLRNGAPLSSSYSQPLENLLYPPLAGDGTPGKPGESTPPLTVSLSEEERNHLGGK